MRIRAGILRGALLVVALSGAARAEEIPRQEYLGYLPPGNPRLVQQNPATVALQLYGDPADPDYRDVDPVDGIDDRRHEVLMALAVRFAPHLVQNTNNLPVNFDLFMQNRETFPLTVDTWEISEEKPELVHTLEVNFPALCGASCGADPMDALEQLPANATADAATEDCKLLALLEQFSPLSTATHARSASFLRPYPNYESVLYFDFPGDGPSSWKASYKEEYERTPVEMRPSFAHSYVHPFVVPATPAPGGQPAYDLILQYWFYYPSNDGGNNHEGDWEHLNVAIAPLSQVREPLTEHTLQRILSGELSASDDATDPLVIRRIEYYFHHFVMNLDFADPNVYAPRKEWKKDIKHRAKDRFRQTEIWKNIRELAYVDDQETIINTHPLGYIGADSKGFDQVMTTPGGKNRNSHGTFPFPGRYHNIGPAGATEQISVYVEPREYWRKVRKRDSVPPVRFERGSVVDLAHPERLRLLPDWERIADQLRTDPCVRRDWSWMVLPVRWGYPATRSPLAGLLPNADTGNLAPHGPTYSSGWNRSGATPGFHVYEPHTLPAVFPLRLQDSFRNDFGFFNLTLPVLFNLPPLDFLTRLGTYPFKLAFSRRDPVYYPKEGLPFRFVGFSSGVSVQWIDKEFNALALNDEQYDQFLGSILVHLLISGADSTTVATRADEIFEQAVGPFFQVPFYIGDRFCSENMVRNFRAPFGFDFDFNNIPSFRYRAELNYWEYAGSLRYSLSTSRLQPFVKAGYGWSWYRIENVQANGVVFNPPQSRWVRPKRIWPNVWHVGLGFEVIPWKRIGTFPRGTELAFRFEYARYMQSLGLDLSNVSLDRLSVAFTTLGDLPLGERVARNDVLFGVTLSF